MEKMELTMSDALRDPMIRLMLRADRVPLRDFAHLLKTAAQARKPKAETGVIAIAH
jgi:hypothetical protein